MRYRFEEEIKRDKRRKIIKEIIIWGAELAAVVLVAFLIVFFCFEKTMVVGDSMAPTLENGNDVIINHLSYKISSPDRFDVVAFKQTDSQEHDYYSIRRIIALPGETVQIKDKQILINGTALEEKYTMPSMENAGIASEPIVLGDGEYFVLGDNRNESEDSRYSSMGNVRESSFIGKVFLKTNPLAMIGGPTK